ncbi:diaminopimelate epimerase [Halodesulfovibrio marinisediminis]|uniref:Diaminopimelate epimerase n=1 Tax=Halodesulfovibrio marinisediminis DSM 17456 TaxID=1121457 RepID=A0A1N6I5Y0_9BACT|nr:diaminopimelate epimerase [Halodesulfovibrio marinisediminis]SIO27448.1 diaminopimelate epimerase [Halodesulfovibrio marinisediminis DSM 17456]
MNPTMEHVAIYKMQGCGNDFVFIDNREYNVPVSHMSEWAQKICRRAFGVGADGLVFLEESDDTTLDYRWHFYNADGSRAEMCGNASRCAAKLAVQIGLAGPVHTFGTDAGPIRAEFCDDGEIKVELTPPQGLELNKTITLKDGDDEIHFVNTGVPHAVYLAEDASKLNVKELGALVRYHDVFAPAGTNANFMSVIDRENVHLRTYERGVEDETFACGTGAVAGVVVAHALGLTGTNVRVKSSGGEILSISIEGDSVFLKGKALVVYTGNAVLESLGLTLD